MKALVSACLAGVPCRYNGGSRPVPCLHELVADGKAELFCPEVAAGLATPRIPAEIAGGDGCDVWHGRARVFDREGRDLTGRFKKGAQMALDAAKRGGAVLAIMAERSPSCGVHFIHDGSFSGAVRPGAGITSHLLRMNHIRLVADDQLALPGVWQEIKKALISREKQE